jgi:Holliday junction DNA helicase RuvA
MIARLKGTLASKSPTGSIVDVQGVGYFVAHSLRTFEGLPAIGGPVELSTHLHVREDALQLYGFSSGEEKTLFELLIGVSGVGPKVALAVLSGLTPVSLARAVADENLGALTSIAGVGRKTAERIVIDLRDKIPGPLLAQARAERGAGAGAEGDAASGKRGARGKAGAPEGPPAGLPGRTWEDAIAALVQLGLTRPIALEQLRKALEDGPAASVEELVRRALAAGAPKSKAPARAGV